VSKRTALSNLRLLSTFHSPSHGFRLRETGRLSEVHRLHPPNLPTYRAVHSDSGLSRRSTQPGGAFHRRKYCRGQRPLHPFGIARGSAQECVPLRELARRRRSLRHERSSGGDCPNTVGVEQWPAEPGKLITW